ncbi:MAG TPA: hypothetical protein PK643_09655 [Saprospiraceae bacterium]|nr:hypothetical protein [Saprospiraceae bacterium]
MDSSELPSFLFRSRDASGGEQIYLALLKEDQVSPPFDEGSLNISMDEVRDFAWGTLKWRDPALSIEFENDILIKSISQSEDRNEITEFHLRTLALIYPEIAEGPIFERLIDLTNANMPLPENEITIQNLHNLELQVFMESDQGCLAYIEFGEGYQDSEPYIEYLARHHSDIQNESFEQNINTRTEIFHIPYRINYQNLDLIPYDKFSYKYPTPKQPVTRTHFTDAYAGNDSENTSNLIHTNFLVRIITFRRYNKSINNILNRVRELKQ